MKRLLFLALIGVAAAAVAGENFAYVRAVPEQADLVVVDARPQAECQAKSLPGARCLPAGDFLGPHRRLPGARDLLWLLGTAGLTGEEDVLVVGGEAQARDFLAGLLYLAGQRSVNVLAEPLGRLLGESAAPGRGRGMVREAVFAAPMRDELLLMRDELRGELAASALPLLDGRAEEEYWGERARAARAGHLPGAISLPAARLRGAPDAAAPALPPGPALAYAHDAYEGLAYLTLLRAGHGVAARLYAEGWAEWAADGALPADSLAYPEQPLAAVVAASPPQPSAGWPSAVLFGAALLIAAAAFAGGWLARPRPA